MNATDDQLDALYGAVREVERLATEIEWEIDLDELISQLDDELDKRARRQIL